MANDFVPPLTLGLDLGRGNDKVSVATKVVSLAAPVFSFLWSFVLTAEVHRICGLVLD